MKRVMISLFFCFVTVCFYGQDGKEFYMYVDGGKRFFEVSSKYILVKSETLDVESVKNAMQKTVAGNSRNVYGMNNNLFMVDMESSSKETLLELQKQWNSREDVIYASPVFIDNDGNEIGGLTNQILIRLKSTNDYSLLQKAIAKYQIKSVKQCDLLF